MIYIKQDKLQYLAEAMQFLGLSKYINAQSSATSTYKLGVDTESGHHIDVVVQPQDDIIAVDYWVDSKPLPTASMPKNSTIVSTTVKNIEKVLNKYGYDIFASTAITAISDRQVVMAAINTRNLAQDLVRVRSSNLWSYGINVRNRKDKTGDVLVQFKNPQGGAGDIYIYYDVPVVLYRRWQSAPSKGHYFWVYIRDNYKYSKLTGNKRGVLKNAIN